MLHLLGLPHVQSTVDVDLPEITRRLIRFRNDGPMEQRALEAYGRLCQDRVLPLNIQPQNLGRQSVFPCPGCNSRFRRQFALDAHMRERHPEMLQEEECPRVGCNFRYTTQTQLYSHNYYHHSGRTRRLPCLHHGCERSFGRRGRALRRRHMLRAHNIDTMFPCPDPDCNWVFPTQQSLDQHVTIRHGPGRHRCKLCGFVARTTNDLGDHYRNAHSTIINGRRRYNCHQCPRHYAENRSLYDHILSTHQHARLRCDLNRCFTEFTAQSHLREHHREVHRRNNRYIRTTQVNPRDY
ncbi:hypothetical protein BC940DRAFT_297080 [Gongronella butleri]|nr:hypothetical protein BC940DRAFT_297080 [Gongronella butleri]